MNSNSTLNNVVLCFIVPPPADRPHSSWRAIVYTRNPPEKTFHGTRTLPTQIEPDLDIMKQELCDPDHIPAHIIQLTEKDQFVYIEGDVCEMLSVEISLADGYKDPYLKRCQSVKKKKSKPKSALILPGIPQSAPSGPLITPGMAQVSNVPISLEGLNIVDITFKTHAVKDQELVDHVKDVAWSHGLKN